MNNTQEIFEVWRDSPYGPISMGLYVNKNEAIKHVKHWNAKCKLKADHASVSARHVNSEFQPDSQS